MASLQWLPWFVAGLVALSCGVGLFLLVRAVGRSVRHYRLESVTPEAKAMVLPVWVRLGAAIVDAPAGQIGPLLPLGLRESIQEGLRRAGIEEHLTPPQFLMLCILGGVMVVILSVLLAAPWWLVVAAVITASMMPCIWLRDLVTRRRDEVLRELPLYVDMLTLALEAGGSLSVALRVATERSPDSVLRRAFQRVQGDLRAGRSRAEALRTFGERLDIAAIKPLVAALIQADASGGSLAAVLRAQSEQRLNERFARAEKRAMEAPVRMLGPLVLCIFPCTFVILAFPVVMRFFAE